MVFLDTDGVSELLRPRPDPAVLAWSKSTPREEVCTASVVEAESRAGIERLPDGRRKRAFERDSDLCSGLALGNRVFPFDRSAARCHAGFVAARARAGRPTGTPDAPVAATARAGGAALVATRTTKGFEGCGVPQVNPWEPPGGGGP